MAETHLKKLVSFTNRFKQGRCRSLMKTIRLGRSHDRSADALS
jgi:hypothetical protein